MPWTIKKRTFLQPLESLEQSKSSKNKHLKKIEEAFLKPP